MKKYIYRRL